MKQLVLFDDPALRAGLLPFTFTRPVADIRVGILRVAEKWAHHLSSEVGFLTQDFLQEKFPLLPEATLFINGACLPDAALVEAVAALRKGESIWQEQTLIAFQAETPTFQMEAIPEKGRKTLAGPLRLIRYPWDIFLQNGQEIRADFALLTAGQVSEPLLDPHTKVYAPEHIFIAPGARVHAAVLNASTGPIYIGKDAEVQEGALIRGPFSMGEGSVVNMGAKVRGDTSLGPHCKIGGEVSNAVFFGYSNKGHDGFLGNAVIGEWCNLGADTNNSNLKNNYAPVKVWDYSKGRFTQTGLQFCGLLMGDHAKCGINTMFNTGTVVGVGANVFGAGFPRNFVPDFSWGGASGLSTFTFSKFEETASVVMKRRGLDFDAVEKTILSHVFQLTAAYRIWEK
ncbi:MAG: GlmU family protein [Nitritalea sp.]